MLLFASSDSQKALIEIILCFLNDSLNHAIIKVQAFPHEITNKGSLIIAFWCTHGTPQRGPYRCLVTLILGSDQLRRLLHSPFIRSRCPAVFLLDPLVNLFPVDDRRRPGLDPKADLLTLNLHNDDFNIVADGDSFANFPGQYQHLTLPGDPPMGN
jgi:hypothetical protein